MIRAPNRKPKEACHFDVFATLSLRLKNDCLSTYLRKIKTAKKVPTSVKKVMMSFCQLDFSISFIAETGNPNKKKDCD